MRGVAQSVLSDATRSAVQWILQELSGVLRQLSPGIQAVVLLIALALIIVGSFNSAYWLLTMLGKRDRGLPKQARERIDQLADQVRVKDELAAAQYLLARDLAYLCSKRGNSDKVWYTLWTSLNRAVITVMQRKQSYHCRACVLVRDGADLVPAVSDGYSVEGQEKLRLPVEGTLAGLCWSTAELVKSDDVLVDKRFVKNPKATRAYRSVLCAPVVVDGRTVAVLNVDALPKTAFKEVETADLLKLRDMARLVYAEGMREGLGLVPFHYARMEIAAPAREVDGHNAGSS
jgi:GAF domain-containing protein